MGLLSVPLKTVLMWYATTQNETLPESYAVCDGTTLTSLQQDINPGSTFVLPDLRNKFILGADITKVPGTVGNTTNTAADAPGSGGTGGSNNKTLAVTELPAHSHTGTIGPAGAHTHPGSTADSGGAHTHTATTNTTGAHIHTGSSTNTAGAHTHSGTTLANAGAHVHTITDPGHTHTTSYTAFFGGGGFGSGSSGNLQSTIIINSATTGITINSNGDHTHTLTIASDGGHSHALTIVSDGDHSHTVTVASGGAHTHTLTLASDGSHTHAFTGDPTGGGTSFDTRPRYHGLVFIMKVKI